MTQYYKNKDRLSVIVTETRETVGGTRTEAQKDRENHNHNLVRVVLFSIEKEMLGVFPKETEMQGMQEIIIGTIEDMTAAMTETEEMIEATTERMIEGKTEDTEMTEVTEETTEETTEEVTEEVTEETTTEETTTTEESLEGITETIETETMGERRDSCTSDLKRSKLPFQSTKSRESLYGISNRKVSRK
jgi:hypothetical protein